MIHGIWTSFLVFHLASLIPSLAAYCGYLYTSLLVMHVSSQRKKEGRSIPHSSLDDVLINSILFLLSIPNHQAPSHCIYPFIITPKYFIPNKSINKSTSSQNESLLSIIQYQSFSIHPSSIIHQMSIIHHSSSIPYEFIMNHPPSFHSQYTYSPLPTNAHSPKRQSRAPYHSIADSLPIHSHAYPD